MSDSETAKRYYKPTDSSYTIEEIEITKLIFERLKKDQCLEESDRETVAYRIAEIMVAAKHMYTNTLTRLINVSGESRGTAHDDLVGLQNSFTHLCDLMYEYDSAYLKALGHPPPNSDEQASGLDGKPV